MKLNSTKRTHPAGGRGQRFHFKSFVCKFPRKCLLCAVLANSVFGAGCESPDAAGVKHNVRTGRVPYYASSEEDSAAKQLTIPTGKSVIYILQGNYVLQGSQMVRSFPTVALVDNKQLRQLGRDTYCMAVLEPGQHKLGIRTVGEVSSGPFSGEGPKVLGKEAFFNLKPNQAYFFEAVPYSRDHIGFIGLMSASSTEVGVEFNELDESRARRLLEKCRLSDTIENQPATSPPQATPRP
jgi:hypothetical protein